MRSVALKNEGPHWLSLGNYNSICGFRPQFISVKSKGKEQGFFQNCFGFAGRLIRAKPGSNHHMTSVAQ